MRKRQNVQAVRPNMGGHLITVMSTENVGAANYVEKTNWRRLEDREVLREGTVLFRPNAGLPEAAQALGNAGLSGLWEAVRPNGERTVVATTPTTLYRFDYATGAWVSIGSGFSSSAPRWQVESIDGYLIFNNTVDLPVTFRVEDSAVSQIRELRETGVACVGLIAVFSGMLLVADLTEIQSAHVAEVLNGVDPYGLVDPSITNRVRYKIGWSDYGAPRNWSPVISGTIEESTKDVVTLEYQSSMFVPGVTRLAIIGAGYGGGTLGGDSSNPDGILLSDVTDNVITLAVGADPGNTFPLSVEVTRFSDVSTFVGSASIKDDSSPIIALKPLNRGILAIYRETGIFHARYTGDSTAPFQFSPVYRGRNVPFYPSAVQSLEGDRHVYPTENAFYVYDGAGEPQVFPVLDAARRDFFAGATAASVFSAHNPITREVWFFCSTGVLAYDYHGNTASWIDEAYSSAAYVRKPDGTATTAPSEFWFILGRGSNVVRYGLTEGGSSNYTRLGVSYTATLRGGLNAFLDENNEKVLFAVTPLMGSETGDVALTLTVYGCDNPALTPAELFSTVITDPRLEPEVSAFFRNIYFQDELVLETSGAPASISARQFKVTKVATDGFSRG